MILCLPLVLADSYVIDTIPTCDGFVKARMYTSEPYTFINCVYNGFMYECPCAKNLKIILNATIEKEEKVVLEYFTRKYEDGISRKTRTYKITQSDVDKKDIEYKIKVEKRNVMAILISVGLLLGIIIGSSILLFKKWYDKIKSEE